MNTPRNSTQIDFAVPATSETIIAFFRISLFIITFVSLM